MAPLSLRHLQKFYGSHKIFDDFNLEVEDGELLCLLGPSGSGKTTLIRAAAGLETIAAGEIWIGDREVSGLPPRDRHIGMTFQGYALYPHLSVRRNLAYPLTVRGTARAAVTRRVEAVAGMLGISHLLDRGVQAISGGEQQRVAIGRAIVQEPRLYLLDEPISNLDASLREQVRGELRRVQQSLRATMVMVTHDQFDALAVADRIAVLRTGVLQQVGTPTELYARPDNLFVASFIGRLRMNLLPGTVEPAEGGARLVGAGFSLPLSPRLAAAATTRSVTLGIRPEALGLLRAATDGAAPARVTALQFQGDQFVCLVRLGDADLQAVTADPAGLAPGAPVWLNPQPSGTHLFATDSGAALAA